MCDIIKERLKMTEEQQKYIKQIETIWGSEGYILSEEDKKALARIAINGNADAEIKKILEKKGSKKC